MKIGTDIFFPRETDQEPQGELLRVIASGLLYMSLAFVLVGFLAFREIMVRVAVIGGSTILMCLVVLWLARAGRSQLASVIFVAFLWIMISVDSYLAGGLVAPIFVGYLPIILTCALLFGNGSGLLVALLSVAFGGFLVIADARHILPPPIQYSLVATLAIVTFFFFIILLLQKAAVDTLRKAIRRANLSEDRYRLFLENIPTVTYINDTSTSASTLYVSPQVEQLLGYTQEEFLQDQTLWLKLVLPVDLGSVTAANQRSVQTGQAFSMDYRLFTKDKKVVWVRDEARLIYDKDGEPMYWLGVWTDITASKTSEEALADAVQTLINRTNQLQTASEVSRVATSILELNELLSRVVELIRAHFEYYYVGIFLADEEQNLATLCAATGEMGREMLALHHSLEIGDSSMVGWCIAHNQARIALDVGKDAVRFKNPLLPLTRSELALPLRSRGQIIGAMTIQSATPSAFSDADITALQTMTDQVANAIETAQLFDERAVLIDELGAKNAELERFAYTISHDLKSPLVTIKGYLGYLRKDFEKNDLNRFTQDLARVLNATDTMQALLQDLLELSRVGRVINPSENVPFETLLKEAMDLSLTPATLEQVRFEVQEAFPVVFCDRVRVVEAIQNLISNAVKFMGDQPDPFVQIGTAGADADTGFPLFFVKDNGIGIAPEFHEKIFGLFNRLSIEKEGTGIGLSLVKRIIEVHGGRIWVASEGKKRGSTFYFTLPPGNQ